MHKYAHKVKLTANLIMKAKRLTRIPVSPFAFYSIIMGESTLFTPCPEAQARFQAQIDLQKLQEYAQRYKPADYKED